MRKVGFIIYQPIGFAADKRSIWVVRRPRLQPEFAKRLEEFDSGLTSSTRMRFSVHTAAHGVISLPLGTPTMKMPDLRGTGRLVIGNLIDSFATKLRAARETPKWPSVSISTFQ
jgi:hypothetical protein